MGDDVPMLVMWKDKRVDDLSREEAIAALKEAAALLKLAEQRLDLWARLARIRRAG